MRRRPPPVGEEGMVTNWFVELPEGAIGPISSSELLRRVRAGEITPETRVRKDDSQWVAAVEVNGLFEAAKKQATHFKCPYCGARVDKPPTVCIECDREVTAVYRVRERPVTPAPASTPPSRGISTPSEVVAKPSTTGTAGNGAERTTVVHAIVTWLRSFWR